MRADFPILGRFVHERPLVYLDNAASSQKPQAVIDAERDVYAGYYANIHRGVHQLSMQSTDAYEAARAKVKRFIGAASTKEVIFTRGTTEGINLVASSYGRKHVAAGDEVLITGLEHHSNIVPWQMLCEEKGAHLEVAPIDDDGAVVMEEFERLLGPRTRIVAVAHVSNALGTVNPVRRMIELAHAQGAVVIIDGAQAAPHLKIDVRALDCDFYALSSHKLYGPTGVGVLYGRQALLEEMPPYQGGGDMILSVTFEKTTYNELPYKFEAGTPNIAGVIGFGAALDYVSGIGLERIAAHEHDLLEYATRRLSEVPGLRIIGTAVDKAAVISFVLAGIHPHDIGTVLDYEGVAIRTGHHCAQPVMERFCVPATARASMAVYNTRDEIDVLVPRPRAGAGAVHMTSPLRELYQEVILDHSKKPRNFGPLPEATRQADGYNPLCGDRATVFVRLDGDVVADVKFQGAGCSISTASASMMTESVKGKSRADAEALFERFHSLVTRDSAAAAARGRSRAGKAGRVLGGLGVPGPREVRVPALAHAEGGARRRRPSGLHRGLGIQQRRRGRARTMMREETVLLRDVEVTAIPYGDRITLTSGSPVIISQALGGSYTLVTMQGYMVRLDGADADAIGKEAQAGPSAEEAKTKTVDQMVWDQLRTCYDPEIPVNIVELGLVHSAEAKPMGDDGGQRVEVRFTLTAPGCGMGDVLKDDIQRKLLTIPGVREADVQVQLDPPWDQTKMSDAARLQLGLM